MKFIAFLVGLSLGVFALRSCHNSPERVAYKSVVAAKAFTDSVKAKHPECSNRDLNTLCQVLTRAVAAKDSLIDAAEIYCSGPSFESGGECNPPDKKTPAYEQAVTKLQSALSSYEQSEKDLKGVLK